MDKLVNTVCPEDPTFLCDYKFSLSEYDGSNRGINEVLIMEPWYALVSV
jgi:hypothetical protein